MKYAFVILALLLAHQAVAQVNVISVITEPPVVQEKPKPRILKRATPTLNEQLLYTHNAVRARHGLYPYRLNPTLARVADDCAFYAASVGYFTHTPRGRSIGQRVAAAGYRYSSCGENGAGDWVDGSGRVYPNMPNDPVSGWMQSPGHAREVLSREHTEAGFAMRRQPNGYRWYVAVYAKPGGYL